MQAIENTANVVVTQAAIDEQLSAGMDVEVGRVEASEQPFVALNAIPTHMQNEIANAIGIFLDWIDPSSQAITNMRSGAGAMPTPGESQKSITE